jgi:Protein of unknown function (DUF2946)
MRLGTWCALFALALQFTLAFGHVHRGETAAALSALSGHGPAATMPDDPAAPPAPVGLAFDYCAICAVVNLTGNAVPTATPGLPVPVVIRSQRFWPDAHTAASAFPHRLFQARAPPVA